MERLLQSFLPFSGGLIGLFSGMSVLSLFEIIFWVGRAFIHANRKCLECCNTTKRADPKVVEEEPSSDVSETSPVTEITVVREADNGDE